MTRAELLARRAHLWPIHCDPDPRHEMQWIEVKAELDWISRMLATLPPDEPRSNPGAEISTKHDAGRRLRGNVGMDRAAGR